MSDKKAHSLNRVIDVAVEAFTSHRLDEMSINEIARQARCSTATIYEVFGSKKELFRIAAKTSIERTGYPRLTDRQDGGLAPLFNYCMTRIAHVSSADRVQGERSLTAHFELAGALMQDFVRGELQYMHEAIGREVVAGIAEGLFVAVDIEAIIHAIVAGTGFEPMVSGNYKLADEPDRRRVLRLTFTPLLTKRGLEALDCFLANWRRQDLEKRSGLEKRRLH